MFVNYDFRRPESETLLRSTEMLNFRLRSFGIFDGRLDHMVYAIVRAVRTYCRRIDRPDGLYSFTLGSITFSRAGQPRERRCLVLEDVVYGYRGLEGTAEPFPLSRSQKAEMLQEFLQPWEWSTRRMRIWRHDHSSFQIDTHRNVFVPRDAVLRDAHAPAPINDEDEHTVDSEDDPRVDDLLARSDLLSGIVVPESPARAVDKTHRPVM